MAKKTCSFLYDCDSHFKKFGYRTCFNPRHFYEQDCEYINRTKNKVADVDLRFKIFKFGKSLTHNLGDQDVGTV